MTVSSTILLTAHEDFTEGIKYLDLIREVLFSSSIKPGKMYRLRRKTIKVLFYVDVSYITALYFSVLCMLEIWMINAEVPVLRRKII